MDNHLHCEQEVEIIKKEQLSSHQNVVENTSTSKQWVEKMNIMNKKVFSENLKLITDNSETDPNMNGNCVTNAVDNLKPKQNIDDDTLDSQTRKGSFCNVSVTDINQETLTAKTNLFVGATTEKTDIIATKNKMEEAKFSDIKTIKDDNTPITSSKLTGIKEEVKTDVTSIQTDEKVIKEENTVVKANKGSQHTVQWTSNNNLCEPFSQSKSKQTSSPNIDDKMNEDQNKQILLKSCWLEAKNVWVDHYKNNDAEKQYHQQLAQQKKWKSDCKEIKSNTTATQDMKINVGNKLRDSFEKIEETKSEEKETMKPKPRVSYEIIEEIIERTEITYYLVNKETDDVHMKEQMKEFETQNLDFKQYLSQLGGYVKILENRVNTLENGQKKDSGERSSSLSSHTSDEGVDMTGGDTSSSTFGFRMKGQKNGRLTMHDEMKNLTNHSKIKNESMVL
eukprot:GFUD01003479.1.p1 GENE.GFUD01003479.1~~GFUD01003479.1.p1  ORF type:complete len:475 (+),score=140.40 GFUD01003479.1:77-1426(+)